VIARFNDTNPMVDRMLSPSAEGLFVLYRVEPELVQAARGFVPCETVDRWHQRGRQRDSAARKVVLRVDGDNRVAYPNINASLLMARVWGLLAGIGGLVHGIGEVLQGSAKPVGLIIDSWTEGPIATNMGGEPAVTVVPNLLLAGSLTILVSLAMMVWAAGYADRRNGGRVLVLLAPALLLTGGGFGPPLIGLVAGWAGTGVHAPLRWWREHPLAGPRHLLATSWPWLCAACFVATTVLVIGSLVLVFVFGVDNAGLFTNLFLVAIVLQLLTAVAGFARDGQQRQAEVRSVQEARSA
jgi:hypothetical protein